MLWQLWTFVIPSFVLLKYFMSVVVKRLHHSSSSALHIWKECRKSKVRRSISTKYYTQYKYSCSAQHAYFPVPQESHLTFLRHGMAVPWPCPCQATAVPWHFSVNIKQYGILMQPATIPWFALAAMVCHGTAHHGGCHRTCHGTAVILRGKCHGTCHGYNDDT